VSTVLEDIESKYPSCLSDITLGQWIRFTNSCKEYDEALAEIHQLPDGAKKSIKLTNDQVARAYAALAFFTGITLKAVQRHICIDDALHYYNERLINLFEDVAPVKFPVDILGASWCIPKDNLTPSSTITFGEFIDSKVIAQAAAHDKQSKWELLQYICAIFLRQPGEAYDEAFVDEDSDRFILMAQLPMSVAMSVMAFFEELNKNIEESFSVFHESDQKEGKAMKEHFKQWGWVNFLKSIAKTKVFDIPNSGMNSIDCARKAKCYEVLIYASEERDYNLAMSVDMEAMYKKQ